jgi:hypothetical protein
MLDEKEHLAGRYNCFGGSCLMALSHMARKSTLSSPNNLVNLIGEDAICVTHS